MTASPLEATSDGVRVALRVIPRSARTSFDGIRHGRLLLRVTAPPVDGAANQAVLGAVALALRVPKGRVTVVSGASTRDKVVEIAGVSLDAARAGLVSERD